MSKRMVIFGAALALVGALAAPAGAQAELPAAVPFNVSILEGPGNIVTSTTFYDFDDPFWTACKGAISALGLPGIPAPAVDGGTGIFLPCWGPPSDTYATFNAAGTTTPTVTEGVPFCVSTLGVCQQNTLTHVTFRDEVKAATGVQPGAYSGSSKGIGRGDYITIDGPGGPPLNRVAYGYNFTWEQSAGTVLPIVGQIDGGGTVISFVTARSSQTPGAGTGGLPSATQTPAATRIFAVDGFAVSFASA